ncbi:hypothetical protein MMC07_005289 [Pseudocyphellaria aurata]|nr:hypothetical protein [Pseudocyphellaria aurata]
MKDLDCYSWWGETYTEGLISLIWDYVTRSLLIPFQVGSFQALQPVIEDQVFTIRHDDFTPILQRVEELRVLRGVVKRHASAYGTTAQMTEHLSRPLANSTAFPYQKTSDRQRAPSSTGSPKRVDLAGGNISTQEAFLRMARVRFDYQVTVSAYLDEPVDGTSSAWPSPGDDERAGDQDDGEEQGKGDQDVSDDEEDELESSPGVCIPAAVTRRYLAANPGIDRSAAVASTNSK